MMNTALAEYFKQQFGCDTLPEVEERDASLWLRHREMCAHCLGIDHCQARGSIAHLLLSETRDSAYLAIGSCKLKKARDAVRKAERLFAEATIPPSLKSCTFASFAINGRGDSIKKAKELAQDAAQNRKSIVLAGSVGTGKTHLAAAIAQETLQQGLSAFFISAIGYLDRLKSTFEKKQISLYTQMIEHVKGVDCLVIDDLGAERPTSWTVERLYDVINARIEQNLQTIITTNFSDTDVLMKHLESNPIGAQRIASRMISLGWLIIEGDDYRAGQRRRKAS